MSMKPVTRMTRLGATLIELLVVIAIISIVVAVAVPQLRASAGAEATKADPFATLRREAVLSGRVLTAVDSTRPWRFATAMPDGSMIVNDSGKHDRLAGRRTARAVSP